ncbi:MAG: MoaD/ThiS family protein [Verrucomicrobiota bacterium]|nr:MoaD/ThiS family protein [Verrucomicrobiota bacterium]
MQFFSHLRDAMRARELELQVNDGATVDDLLGQLYARTPALRDWDKSILVGAGLEFVGRDHPLQPNEEIALMPPVQGG